jgi:hypothetical protein
MPKKGNWNMRDFHGYQQARETGSRKQSESDLPLVPWLEQHGYNLILGELVLRAKTIEANELTSAGASEETTRNCK